MARPRSTRAHEQVLEAALELFSERGIDATSMDAIAAASGVSKATIYKHWPDKDALTLEVMAHLHGLDEEPPDFDSDDLGRDLSGLLRYQPAADRAALKTRMMPHLLAYSARKPEFGQAWRALVMDPPRLRLIKRLKRAAREGQLAADTNDETAVALLIGPMLYRHIFHHLLADLPEDMPERVVAAFLRAHTPKRETGLTRRTGKSKK